MIGMIHISLTNKSKKLIMKIILGATFFPKNDSITIGCTKVKRRNIEINKQNLIKSNKGSHDNQTNWL